MEVELMEKEDVIRTKSRLDIRTCISDIMIGNQPPPGLISNYPNHGRKWFYL